jgi:rare lipoprotein A
MSGISRRVTLLLLAGAVTVLLAACAGEAPRVEEPADGPSTTDLKPGDVADAVPRAEPLARYGNHSPYEVFGRKYHVLPSSKGYHERGTASWYGSKFHGRRTSSGEPYDMHLATAAHKSLPLPTYAEVTNLENGRKVIVKINDRGPFKDDRLIDMSYGAALRLGMTQTGTARVEVRAIDVDNLGNGVVVKPVPVRTVRTQDTEGVPSGNWLQAGAFGSENGARSLASRLEISGLSPVSVHQAENLFRVWLGPYSGDLEMESVIARAIELGFDRPHKVKR